MKYRWNWTFGAQTHRDFLIDWLLFATSCSVRSRQVQLKVTICAVKHYKNNAWILVVSLIAWNGSHIIFSTLNLNQTAAFSCYNITHVKTDFSKNIKVISLLVGSNCNWQTSTLTLKFDRLNKSLTASSANTVSVHRPFFSYDRRHHEQNINWAGAWERGKND